jgi:chromosome segregation protein
LLALDHQLRQLNENRERNTRRLNVTRAEIERLTQEAARTNEQRAASQGAIEQREKEKADAEEALASLRESISEGKARRAALAEEQTGLRTALAALEERLKSAMAALERMKREVAEHTSRRDHIANQIGQWETQRTQLLANNVELEAEIAARKARRTELDEGLTKLAAELEASRRKVEAHEQTVREKREELDALRERRSAIELRLVEVRSDAKRLEETSLRDLNKPIAEIELPEGEPLSAEELDEAQREYESVRMKIENLGPVNILALEEYEEAHQREEFLETQRTDLIDSIRDTQQAIAEIDNVSKKKFQEAYEAINIHFRELFKTLFGGGVGEMRLTDESNPGESGVDIVASPPGKRLQNVALLSGGEKSLTALALLMATFKYKPSPFCVLDEVDAALDESNIRRFRRLIQEMAGTTQFIVITHSKTTMEAAQSLYGVTMQEPGVSKLVSVLMHEGTGSAPTAETREAVGAGV